MKHLLLYAALFSLLLAACSKQTTPTVPPDNTIAKAETPTTADTAPAETGKAGETKTYTAADVALHATASDCWLIIVGKVYDVTKYLPSHPAGEASIARGCGKDVTQWFARHSERAQAFKEKFLIGNLATQ